jgi:hypothetical protein
VLYSNPLRCARSDEDWRNLYCINRAGSLLRKKLREESAVESGKGTAAQAYGADGASGVRVREKNVGAGRFFVEGHLGDEGDTHPGGNMRTVTGWE